LDAKNQYLGSTQHIFIATFTFTDPPTVEKTALLQLSDNRLMYKGCIVPTCAQAMSGSPGQMVKGTQVESIFCCSGWVGSAIFGLGLDLNNFP